MAENRIVPMIAYEDAAGAIDWLVKAFGFRERLRYTDDDGRVSHAELELGGGLVMLATPTPDYVGPRRHRETCDQARKWSGSPYIIDGVLVEVDDVREHFAQAQQAGARILSEPEDVVDIGVRHYRAEDPEGHRWMFSQEITAPENPTN